MNPSRPALPPDEPPPRERERSHVLQALHRDEQGIILGFFIRLLVVFAIVILALFEGGAILFAHLRADDAASAGALAAAVEFRKDHDVALARQAAIDAAHEKAPGVQVTKFVLDPRKGTATVTTKEIASTLVVKRVGFLRKLGIIRATETASPPTL